MREFCLKTKSRDGGGPASDDKHARTNCAMKTAGQALCVSVAFSFYFGPASLAQAAAGVSEPKDAGIFYHVEASGSLGSLEYVLAPKRYDLELKGDVSSTRIANSTGLRFAVKLSPGTEVAVVKPYVDRGARVIPRHFVNHKLVPEEKKGAALVKFETVEYGSGSTLITVAGPLTPGEYCMGVASGYDEYCFGVDTGEIADSGAAGGGGTSSGATGPAGSAITNADVIKLVNAGLSGDVIASTVSNAPARNFDLSVDGLIALKQAHVPDAVIQAMTRAGASAAPPAAAASGSAAAAQVADASIQRPEEAGRFFIVGPGGKLRKMEPARAAVAKVERDLFEGNQASYRLYGAHSPVRVTDPNVALVVKIVPKDNKFHLLGDYETHDVSDLYYRRFETVEGARQTYVSAEKRGRHYNHTPDPGEFEFTVTKLAADLYKVTPKEPLIPGEYCISPTLFTSIDPIDCFGVDGPR
jgi:hypothetical protein